METAPKATRRCHLFAMKYNYISWKQDANPDLQILPKLLCPPQSTQLNSGKDDGDNTHIHRERETSTFTFILATVLGKLNIFDPGDRGCNCGFPALLSWRVCVCARTRTRVCACVHMPSRPVTAQLFCDPMNCS